MKLNGLPFNDLALNSYSYDGNRQKKWNLVSSDYGDKWEQYDVISCCIDLDNCTVSFYRNGKFLGIAFDKIQTGSGRRFDTNLNFICIAYYAINRLKLTLLLLSRYRLLSSDQSSIQ